MIIKKKEINDGLVFPDYENSIVNLVSSILKAFDTEPLHPALMQPEAQKLKDSKNLIFFVFDGMGYNLLKRYSRHFSSFLWDNCVGELTSVFPCTTTGAITSFLTGKTPLEHGALGWTLYFKEFFKLINFLPHTDAIYDRKLDDDIYKTLEILKIENIFSKIKNQDGCVDINYFIPDSIKASPFTTAASYPSALNTFFSEQSALHKIEKIIKKDSCCRNFIYSYFYNPDSLMHRNGTNHDQVIEYIKDIDMMLENFAKNLEGTDTALVITADHGLIDIEKYHYINDDEELYDSLLLPVLPEPRFGNFFVKRHKDVQFHNAIEKYKDSFRFFNREEFLESGLLGNGEPHKKIDDFIGDYVMIGTGKNGFLNSFMQKNTVMELAAHHCGLTADEMLVPLIIKEL